MLHFGALRVLICFFFIAETVIIYKEIITILKFIFLYRKLGGQEAIMFEILKFSACGISLSTDR